VLPRLGISQRSLALQLKISRSTVSRILNERRRITGDLAAKLARISGTSALYWLVVQAHHDAWRLERALVAPAYWQVGSARQSPKGRRPSRPAMPRLSQPFKPLLLDAFSVDK
jgi:addiction module HigA family antidote